MRYLLHEPAVSKLSGLSEIWLGLHGATGTAEQGLELFGKVAETQQALLVACQGSRPLGDGFAWSFAQDQFSIINVIDMLLSKYSFNQEPIGLCAFSMGCAMGLWLLANYPDRFRFFVAVSMGSAFEPWEFDDGGLNEVGLRQAAKITPVFLSVDQYDPYGCASYFEQNLTKLRELGFEVQPFTPNEKKHAVTPLIINEIVRWICSV